MTATLKRKPSIKTLVLLKGGHATREAGVCALEALAWIAGEGHTDHPACVSEVLGTFVRRWNDDLDDKNRQRLKPYLKRMIGTDGDKKADDRRGWMLVDWMVRVYTPAWLELVPSLKEHADTLRALPAITSPKSLSEKTTAAIAEANKSSAAARDAARAAAWAAAGDAARDAARAAAWAAAGDAAGAAARDAAGDAAWAAAWAAAWDAAGAAAWDAAGAAAGAAAGDAARDAAEKKLEPVKVSLIESAFDLLDRMIAA